jgi:hypothetical protein
MREVFANVLALALLLARERHDIPTEMRDRPQKTAP